MISFEISALLWEMHLKLGTGAPPRLQHEPLGRPTDEEEIVSNASLAHINSFAMQCYESIANK